MSTEKGEGNLSSPSEKVSPLSLNPTDITTSQTSQSEHSSQLASPPQHGEETPPGETSPMDLGDKKPPAKRDHSSERTFLRPQKLAGNVLGRLLL
jgi:hypothetical protein